MIESALFKAATPNLSRFEIVPRGKKREPNQDDLKSGHGTAKSPSLSRVPSTFVTLSVKPTLTKMKKASLTIVLFVNIILGASGSAPISSVRPNLQKSESETFLKRADHGSSDGQTSKLSKHGIVLTDLKLDDTAMIQVAMVPKKYAMLHIVTSAVKDHAAAHGHLLHFLRKQGLLRGEDATTPIKVYSAGADILEQDIERTHEPNFLGHPVPTQLRADRDLLSNLPEDTTVDIFHIAPTAAALIYRLVASKRIQVSLYHHVAGYNSYQDPLSHRSGTPTAATREFLETIGDRIHTQHPGANVVFTNSYFSFDNFGGSTQPLEAFKGRIDDEHLDFALRDPFFRVKLTEAEEAIAHLREDSFLPPLIPSDSEFADKSLQTLVTMARFMQPPEAGRKLRTHFIRYLDYITPLVRGLGTTPKLASRLDTGVREGFTKSPSIELCDAVQAVCVLDVLNHAATSFDTHKHSPQLVPIHWYLDTERHGPHGLMMLRRARPHEKVHGFSLVGQTAGHARHLLYESFPMLHR